MKKLTALLLGAAMAFSLAACSGTDSSSSESTAPESSSAAEDTSSEASGEEASGTASAETASYDVETVEDGVLIMSTNAAFPPYEMTNDAGEYEGIDVEMAGEIAKRLGLELEIDDMDFDSALLAVQQGKSDIAMAGITVSEDRLLVMDFSDSYANGVQVIIVPEDSDNRQPRRPRGQADRHPARHHRQHLLRRRVRRGRRHHLRQRPDRRAGADQRPAGLRHHRQRPGPVFCGGQPRPEDPGHRLCRGRLRHRRGQGQHPAAGTPSTASWPRWKPTATTQAIVDKYITAE